MIWRFRFSFIIFLLFFVSVIARLFYWQIVKAEELSALGESQYGQKIKTFPDRGEIRTSDNFPVATNRLSFLIFANPKEVKDKDNIAKVLSPFLETDSASISADLSLNRFWVPLKQNINNETKEKIEAMMLPGIGFEQKAVRFYPEASMAAHLLGFVGKDNTGEDKGYFGLEGYYDRQLRGKEAIAIQVHDAFNRPILSKMNKDSTEVEGRTLILNINRSIQFLLEKKLKEGMERYGAVGAMASILDPKSGNVLAIASFPSFDQRNFSEYDPLLYKNPFITNLYEPGSTFKALIMALALDAKAVKPETKCTICSGPITIGDYQIKTWNDKYFENINMIDVIRHSDNTGMVFAGQTLGLEKMLSYLKKFGIGDLTGIDLEGEVAPEIRPESSWYPIDLATASFGQGISVTPIELLVAFSAIGNDGKRMEPHVVSKIITGSGRVIEIKPKVVDAPIKSETAKMMTEILVNAVNLGEAKWTRLKGYRIAGKTGTAQIPIEGHYDPNKTIASFIGFAPADNPKFSMLIIIDRPTKSIYGSETAAPIFFDIAKDLFAYYKIQPTE